jgi:hypothetical protein
MYSFENRNQTDDTRLNIKNIDNFVYQFGTIILPQVEAQLSHLVLHPLFEKIIYTQIVLCSIDILAAYIETATDMDSGY